MFKVEELICWLEYRRFQKKFGNQLSYVKQWFKFLIWSIFTDFIICATKRNQNNG